ncbi:adenosylcobinamide amidohydrolase [Catellatospora methionotrophica]|uniref:Adenosylcobinamide amidohydrolase n=1 Tax=Catellatospora methionotrophica TaxID=121620 RepID=A0A8J3PD38_9ACTN|nr:adenosylcobinamide amidohydrolase [Catellatospora methionotrophica]GIG12647.1 adenosylcobinamide amidohydrolase [Catellatospora methionotrophica]
MPNPDAVLLRALLVPHEDESGAWPALVWQAGDDWQMISSAVLGGGMGPRAWVLNAQVGHGYTRLDPERHLAEIAQRHGLTGPGVGLMTAARVTEAGFATDGGAEALVTAGIGVSGWAAQPPDAAARPAGLGAHALLRSPDTGADVAVRLADPGADAQNPGGAAFVPGTINIMVAVPVALSPAALVNAVATATEAKVQALRDAGFDASGTPTDAVCVAARAAGEQERFAGPRSAWGSRLARAVHAATVEAALRYRARRLS